MRMFLCRRAFTLAMSGAVALIGCRTQLTAPGNFLECDQANQCASGYRCAHTELGAVCLDEEQWQARCAHDEVCNGLDDDCDGEADEDLEDRPIVTDERVCDAGLEWCDGGVYVTVRAPILAESDDCDGIDNDCDDAIDEEAPIVWSGTADGECERSMSECIDGEYVVVEFGIEPISEACNDLDDDCDGEVDEDFPELDAPCADGVGACAASGTYRCGDDGDTVCSAVAGNPGAEVCDELDNNCDGTVDDPFAELADECSVGVGECRVEGERICREDGLGTRCDVEPGTPSAETCNGLDDDCDGVIDNGISDCCIPGTTRTCGNDFGACTVGTQTCDAERVWGLCSGVSPIVEVCNGEDDDCDGEADEALADCCEPSATIACSVDRGACVAGTQTCTVAQVWSACNGILPSPDRCNGRDDDCDGETDEDFSDLEESCSVGQGACADSGARMCNADETGTVCSASAGSPTEETCNLVDDDCDGEVDDGLVVYTGTDVGACQQGIERCIDGEFSVVQERIDPVVEICDGLDQDCDGIADDEAPSCCTPEQVRTCGISVGMCTIGSQTCGPDFSWSVCTGIAPSAERCNSLDDDCSGAADDPWALQLGGACTSGIGACGRLGVYECNPDFSPSVEGEREGVMCTAVAGSPGIETCNGLDDDCDGSRDEVEDVPPILDGSDIGRCDPRVLACVGGDMVEVLPGFGPSAEVCNGLDDDCNGSADDGITSVPCYDGPSGTNGIGTCDNGATTCTDGAVSCIGQVLPAAETCNGFDDDCDGAVDGLVEPGGDPIALVQPCYSGPPSTLGVGACRNGFQQCVPFVGPAADVPITAYPVVCSIEPDLCHTGWWSACTGDVTPETERCPEINGFDDDCDGETDEWQVEQVVVPEGAFTMGSPDGVGNADEYPQHSVLLSGFCIDRYEVSNARYRACVDLGACDPPASEDSRTRIGYFRDSSYDQFPVVNVTWSMADAFCQWEGKQLPTEAQWEKAARGTDAWTYPWGEDAPTCELAWFFDCLPQDTVAVGTLPLGVSPYGALHMAGNVGEWVADWYGDTYYAASPSADPIGPAVGASRVFRGGSFGNPAIGIRCARRGGDRSPSESADAISFRCAQ